MSLGFHLKRVTFSGRWAAAGGIRLPSSSRAGTGLARVAFLWFRPYFGRLAFALEPLRALRCVQVGINSSLSVIDTVRGSARPQDAVLGWVDRLGRSPSPGSEHACRSSSSFPA
jgi:hypothetical protein